MIKTALAFVGALPVVGRVVDWFRNKKRLYIEYTLVALFVAFGGLALSLWLTKRELKDDLAATTKQLDAVKGRLTTVEFRNTQLEETANNLRDLRARDNEALQGLLTEFEDLSTKNRTVRTRLTELEKTNEAVRDLRNQPIPPELSCVLEPRSCQAGDQIGTRR